MLFDGHKLLKSGWHAVKISQTKTRLCFDEQGSRKTVVFRPGKLGQSGATCVWGQFGCAQSRAQTLKKVLKAFQKGESYALVWEDDC